VSGFFGVSAALLTPFNQEGSIAHNMMAAHAAHVLDNGCSSIALFGTTGEGASLGLGERMGALAHILDAGIDPGQIVLGVKSDAIADVIEELRTGIRHRCSSFLLAPPHFFKGVCDAGLYAWFCQVFEAFPDQQLRIILYNIPQLTGVAISPALAQRLHARFPALVFGVKDSSGEWESAQGFLALRDDLAILIGDERFLARSAGLGAQGCISGLANFYGKELLEMLHSGEQNTTISQLVELIVRLPVVPAIKVIASDIFETQQWLNIRPPLAGLSTREQERLVTDYKEILVRSRGA